MLTLMQRQHSRTEHLVDRENAASRTPARSIGPHREWPDRPARRVTWGSTQKKPLWDRGLDYLAETQGFEPWMQVLARMLP